MRLRSSLSYGSAIELQVLELLSLRRSSIVSLVAVHVNVDDYGVGYNLSGSNVESGVAVVEVYVRVRTNQLAGVRPVIADCNVALRLALGSCLLRCLSCRYDLDVVVSLLVRAGERNDHALVELGCAAGLLGLNGLDAVSGYQVKVDNSIGAIRLLAAVGLLNNAVQSIGVAQVLLRVQIDVSSNDVVVIVQQNRILLAGHRIVVLQCRTSDNLVLVIVVVGDEDRSCVLCFSAREGLGLIVVLNLGGSLDVAGSKVRVQSVQGVVRAVLLVSIQGISLYKSLAVLDQLILLDLGSVVSVVVLVVNFQIELVIRRSNQSLNVDYLLGTISEVNLGLNAFVHLLVVANGLNKQGVYIAAGTGLASQIVYVRTVNISGVGLASLSSVLAVGVYIVVPLAIELDGVVLVRVSLAGDGSSLLDYNSVVVQISAYEYVVVLLVAVVNFRLVILEVELDSSTLGVALQVQCNRLVGNRGAVYEGDLSKGLVVNEDSVNLLIVVVGDNGDFHVAVLDSLDLIANVLNSVVNMSSLIATLPLASTPMV